LSHKNVSSAISSVSSPISGLANFRVLALLIAVLTVSMVSTFNVNTASASHSGSVVCDTVTTHCYEHVMTAANWDVAKATAEGMTHNGVSGHLATLTSETEDQFIVANFLTAVSTSAYIGGFRNGTSGNSWSWVTGETWNYTKWSPGYPPEPTLGSL
jgi:hypothetical protein